MERLVYEINEDACILFLCKYGKGELTYSIKRFINGVGKSLLDKYQDWIKWKNTNQINFGGVRNHIVSERFKIDEVIFEYEWGEVKGGWCEIFQYIWSIQNGYR